MPVKFSDHAEEKLRLLEKRGFVISKKQVLDCIEQPDRIEDGYKERRVAQKVISPTHVIRVVYSEGENYKRVITVYPGRRKRYEDKI